MPSTYVRDTSGLIGTEYNGLYGGSIVPKYGQSAYTEKNCRYGLGGCYGYPDFNGRNVGQAWYLESTEINRAVVPVGKIWRGGALGQYYVGSVICDVPGSGLWTGTHLPDSYGASAYSKMKPAQPNFQALNAIYELKDLPGMLRQRMVQGNLKNMSNYWLALQFGWKPLLADIRNMVQTQMNGQKRLQQLLRDNGRPVRRHLNVLDVTSNAAESVVQSYSTVQPVFVTQYYDMAPVYRERHYDRERVWASARFRYWLPPGPQDVEWKANMMHRIFGLQFPSPSVIYNAIPWSWLVDWFSNVGDVLENIDSGVADRLAADYFYIMRRKDYVREQFSQTVFHRESGEKVPVSGTSTVTTSVRTRGVGDPFGFATNANTLSGMQLSILGALGMSRLR